MTRRPRRQAGAAEAAVLRHIANAEKEGREWSYGTIAEDLQIHRSHVAICVLRLRANGQLVEGAQKIVRVGLVVAKPETSAPTQGV